MVVKTLIKAVWFDDEWKSDEDFIDVCLKKHGIQIEPFQSTNPGLKYLSENYLDIDIVILDAWFTEEDDQKYDDTGSQAIKVRNAVDKLEKEYPIEIFVYTATPRKKLFNTNFPGRIYIKTRNDEEMFHDIHNWYNSREDINIKKDFKSALNVCTDKYIGKKNYDRLFNILKRPDDYSMSEIRKIIYSSFNALQDKNIIPSEQMGVYKEAEKSRFFAGGYAFSSWKDKNKPWTKSKEEAMGKNYKLKEKYMTPVPIADIEKYLYNLSTNWSHDQKKEEDNPDQIITGFGKVGALHNLCELLVYIKWLIDKKLTDETAWEETKVIS